MTPLKHENLDQTSYYRVGLSDAPNNRGSSMALRGRFALSLGTSLASAVKYYVLSVFRSKTHKQLAGTHLYSAKKSFQAIWNPKGGYQKVHLFVLKKSVLNASKNSFLGESPDLGNLNQPTQKKILDWIQKASKSLEDFSELGKFIIQSLLSMDEQNLLGQDLAAQRENIIQLIINACAEKGERIFIYKGEKNVVKSLKYRDLSKHIRDFPRLIDFRGKLKYYITENEKESFDQLCSLIGPH